MRLIFQSLLLAFLLPLGGMAADYTVKTIPNVRLSDRNNYVSNPDQILNPADVSAINAALRIVEDSLGIEVAVVAVESIGDHDARTFATDLFEYWGIGKKGADNGLLIQLVTEPVQRSVVFETGYGLEGVLPDALCYRLQQQYMIPEMKAGNYSAGMLNGVLAVKDYLLAGDYEQSDLPGEESYQNTSAPVFLILLLFFSPLLLIILLMAVYYVSKYRKRPCPRCGQKTFRYMGQKTIQSPTYTSSGLAESLYQCSACGYAERKSHTLPRRQRSTSSGGSSFGGGSHSSGGGSWGGGRSGGGGSISRF